MCGLEHYWKWGGGVYCTDRPLFGTALRIPFATPCTIEPTVDERLIWYEVHPQRYVAKANPSTESIALILTSQVLVASPLELCISTTSKGSWDPEMRVG